VDIKKQASLVILNSYYRDQEKLHNIYIAEGKKLGIEVFTLSRTSIQNVQQNIPLFAPQFLKKSEPSLKEIDLRVRAVAKIFKNEINFDRDFIKYGGFGFIGRNKLPSNLHEISTHISTKIVHLLIELKPTCILTGHCDNWIGTMMFRVGEMFNIPTGFALETFVDSGKALVIDRFSYNNSRMKPTPKFFSNLSSTQRAIPPAHSMLEQNEKSHLSGEMFEKKNRIAQFRDLVMSEIKAPREFFWRIKNGYARWMLVDQVLPGVNLLRSIQSNFNRIINYFFYRMFTSKNLKNINKPICIVMLHMEPEAAQLAFAREFIDQLKFVEQLNQLLGDTFDIYAKEHPGQDLGLRKLNFYWRLRAQTKGFISRETGFLEMAESSEQVTFATLHGTVAYLCAENKKVCILGSDHSYHGKIPGSIHFSELVDSRDLLQRMIELNASISSFGTTMLWDEWDKEGLIVEYPSDTVGQLKLIKYFSSQK